MPPDVTCLQEMQEALTPQQFIDCIDASFVPHLFMDQHIETHRMRSECGVWWYFVRDAAGRICMQIDARADRRKLRACVAIGRGAMEARISYTNGEIVVSLDEADTGQYARVIVVGAFDYEKMFTLLMEHCEELLATDCDPRLPFPHPAVADQQ